LGEYEIAMAICYEISVPLHAKQAHKNGSQIYIASVAKTISGMKKALETLSETAKRYSMVVLLSNCVGECEGKEAGGRSSVWNNKGILLGQLDNVNEGMLILDTTTQEVTVQKVLSAAKKIS
jgi:predicted amidohydrolase